MIEVITVDTGADADVLSGTDLANIPEAGLLIVFMASTVNTATLSAGMGGRQASRAISIPLRTNGVPNVDQDNPVLLQAVDSGPRPVLDLGGTTGTVFTIARFFTAAEVEAGLVS